ncbi:MAG TPA: AAA family ATPase [Deltaproteobacteria bacterium]|nr:AAA family ATPase [Deltaproteobacteria bacterium]HCP45291.1 AAA family ATPase [Deltaproteobacteria bacterium]
MRDQFMVADEPYYVAVEDEVALFEEAAGQQFPVLLKGPTGSGKTRFVAYMAWKLGRPLVTVACHEDLSAADLVGRYLFREGETQWVDGPLSTAVKLGGICYLDEVVEARNDSLVVIHPLADDRRILPVEKRNELLKAPDDFMLVVSYNPAYQSIMKDLKQSTRQRFLGLSFDYPPREIETEVVAHETGLDTETASRLVRIGARVRKLKSHGLEEGVSTRLLVYAGRLMASGLSAEVACRAAIVEPLSDDPDLQRSMAEVIRDFF